MDIDQAAYNLSQEMLGKTKGCRVRAGTENIYVYLVDMEDAKLFPANYQGYNVKTEEEQGVRE